MAGGVMAGRDLTENALEARSQPEKLQTDRVWVPEPWSWRVVERRVAAATREHVGAGTNAPVDGHPGR